MKNIFLEIFNDFEQKLKLYFWQSLNFKFGTLIVSDDYLYIIRPNIPIQSLQMV